MPNQLPETFTGTFFSVSFMHHYSIVSKCQSFDEAWYYIQKTAAEFWNYRQLEQQIKADLYGQALQRARTYAKVRSERWPKVFWRMSDKADFESVEARACATTQNAGLYTFRFSRLPIAKY